MKLAAYIAMDPAERASQLQAKVALMKEAEEAHEVLLKNLQETYKTSMDNLEHLKSSTLPEIKLLKAATPSSKAADASPAEAAAPKDEV